MSKMTELNTPTQSLRAMLSGQDLSDLSAILTLLRVATENDQVMSHPTLAWHREQAYRIKALVQDV